MDAATELKLHSIPPVNGLQSIIEKYISKFLKRLVEDVSTEMRVIDNP